MTLTDKESKEVLDMVSKLVDQVHEEHQENPSLFLTNMEGALMQVETKLGRNRVADFYKGANTLEEKVARALKGEFEK